MKVIDEAAFVCMNAPKCAKTIGDYCMELEEKALKIANDVQRTDFVFDVYKDHGLKLQTQETHINSVRIAVFPKTPFPKDFQRVIVNPSILCTKLE